MSTETYRVNFGEVKKSVSMEQVVDFLGIPGLKKKSGVGDDEEPPSPWTELDKLKL